MGVLGRLLLSTALFVAASCGVEPGRSPTAERRTPSAQTDSVTYHYWADSHDLTCAHIREEIAAGRPNAEGELSERPYRLDFLPGFAAPPLTPVDAATARRMFGPPCSDVANVWAIAMPAFDVPEDEAMTDFAAVRRPMLLRLPDGRSVVLAPVMPGDSHATTGFYAARVLGANQQQFFAMDGGGTFGDPGKLSVPLHQPPGAFHVWLEGGGTWQGATQGWAAITDFAGATPQNRGRFLRYGYIPCNDGVRAEGAACRGTTEYSISSVRYADSGELTLVWLLETFDEASGQRVNRHARALTARYALRDGVYRLVEGAEPPPI